MERIVLTTGSMRQASRGVRKPRTPSAHHFARTCTCMQSQRESPSFPPPRANRQSSMRMIRHPKLALTSLTPNHANSRLLLGNLLCPEDHGVTVSQHDRVASMQSLTCNLVLLTRSAVVTWTSVHRSRFPRPGCDRAARASHEPQ